MPCLLFDHIRDKASRKFRVNKLEKVFCLLPAAARHNLP